VNANCNDGSDCSYSYPITQNSNELTFYQVQVTGKDGSSVSTNIARSIIDCTAGHLSLFPNPAGSLVNLNYSSPKGQSNTDLLIYDILGRVVLRKTISVQEGLNQMSLPLNNLADGVYLLVLDIQNNRISTQRFVIQH
jgi:hypothetical protein